MRIFQFLYTQHVIAAFALMMLGALFSAFGQLVVFRAITFAGVTYFVFIILGLVSRKGPLKEIGEDYIRRISEGNERTKQVWEE